VLFRSKTPISLPKATLSEEGFSIQGGFTEQELEALNLFEANHDGCNKCNRGYKGRVGIYEMLAMSPEIAEVIMENGNSLDILKVANTQDFQSLRLSGLKKVAEGITSLEEMNRVIKT
jgi:type IV pilus assembly protein PilB